MIQRQGGEGRDGKKEQAACRNIFCQRSGAEPGIGHFVEQTFHTWAQGPKGHNPGTCTKMKQPGREVKTAQRERGERRRGRRPNHQPLTIDN